MPRSFLRREPQSPKSPSAGPGAGASAGGLLRQLVNRAASGSQASQRSPGRSRQYEHTIPIPSEPQPYFPVPRLATPTTISPLDHWAEVTEFGQIRPTSDAVDAHTQGRARAQSQSRPIVISEETLARMRGFRARADSLEIDDWPAEQGVVLGISSSPGTQTVPSTPIARPINPENLVPLEDLFQVPTVRLTPHGPQPAGFSDSVPPTSSKFGGLLSRSERDMSRSSSGEAIREVASTVAQTTVSVARSMTKKLSVDSLLGRKRSKEARTAGPLERKHSRLDILGQGRSGSRSGGYEAMPPTPPTPARPFMTAPLPAVPSPPAGAPRTPLPAMRLVRQNRFGLPPASAANAIAHSARPRAMGTLELNTMPTSRHVSGSAPVSPFADPPTTPRLHIVPLPDECTPTPKTAVAPAPPAVDPDTFRTPVQPRPLAHAIPSTPTLSAGHRCRVPGSTFNVSDVQPGSAPDQTPLARPPRSQWQTRILSGTDPNPLSANTSPSDSPQLPRAELLAFLFPSPPPRIPLPPTPTLKHPVLVRPLSPARPDNSPIHPQALRPAHASVSPILAPTPSESSDKASQALPDAEADGDRSFDSIQSTESVQALQISHQRSMTEMQAAFRRMRGLAHTDHEPDHLSGGVSQGGAEGPAGTDESTLSQSNTLDELEASLHTAMRATLPDRSHSPSPPRLASPADLPSHTPRESISSHQFSDVRSTVTHTTLHPDDSRSNIAFHAVERTPPPPLPLPTRSRASSLGESAVERVERREGQGWLSTPRRESDDKSIEQLEYAARSAVAAMSPIRQTTPRAMTPLARTSRRLILASEGRRPMSAEQPYRRDLKVRHVSSPVQHAVAQWRQANAQSTSLTGNGAGSRANDGTPTPVELGPLLRAKRSRPRVCSEAMPVIVSSPFGPSSSNPQRDKGKARAVSSSISRNDSLKVSQPQSAGKTFAREVSPEIARRATQLAQRIESSSSGYTSSSRRAEVELMSTAPTSLEPTSEDEQTPTKVHKPVVGKVKSAVLDLNSIQRKHESEIDTLVTLLSQTREENKGLRQQVDSLQATVSATQTPEAGSSNRTPRARQRIASSPVVSPLSRKNLAKLEDLYTPRSRAKTGFAQKSTLREAAGNSGR